MKPFKDLYASESSKIANSVAEYVEQYQIENQSPIPTFNPQGFQLGFDLVEFLTGYQKYSKTFEHKKKKIRGYFVKVAIDIMRNSNSSSILERWFSDSLRSLSSRRYKLSVTNLSREGFLRTMAKNIASLLELAEDLKLTSNDSPDGPKLKAALDKAKQVLVFENEMSDSDEDTIEEYNDLVGISLMKYLK